MRLGSALALAGLIWIQASSAARPQIEQIDLSELWQEPFDLRARDLFHGRGGAELAPDLSQAFELVAEDREG